MRDLLVSDLEKMDSDINEIAKALLIAVNDWPKQIFKLEDYESEVSIFIGQEPTAKTINLALMTIDYTLHAWQAESLSELLNVFSLYEDNVSFKEIIVDLKKKL